MFARTVTIDVRAKREQLSMRWGEDDLTKFLEVAHSNQKAIVTHFPDSYAFISRVNKCFVLGGKHLIDPKPIVTGIFFLRSQYAYKAASGVALSGQVVESFAMMRLCLEYAGYALLIFTDPSLESVFMKRHFGADDMKTQKGKFKISEVKAAIASFDRGLAGVFQALYDRTIDFGAHPNPYAALSALKRGEDALNHYFEALALSSDPKVLVHAMKSAAQVGLTSLHIFEHIFRAKFQLLGIRTEMDALRSDGL